MPRDVQLTKTPWNPEGAPTIEDAIYSLLAEDVDCVYMPPNRQRFYIVARGVGLILVPGDFSETTEEELDEIVNDVWEVYDV